MGPIDNYFVTRNESNYTGSAVSLSCCVEIVFLVEIAILRTVRYCIGGERKVPECQDSPRHDQWRETKLSALDLCSAILV